MRGERFFFLFFFFFFVPGSRRATGEVNRNAGWWTMSAGGPRLVRGCRDTRARIFYTYKSKVIAYVTMACTCALHRDRSCLCTPARSNAPNDRRRERQPRLIDHRGEKTRETDSCFRVPRETAPLSRRDETETGWRIGGDDRIWRNPVFLPVDESMNESDSRGSVGRRPTDTSDTSYLRSRSCRRS